MKKQILEKNLVNKILKYLNSRPNTKAGKNHGSVYSTGGRPDIDVSDNGRHGVIEVKVGRNQLTAIQAKQMRDWEEAGSKTLVAYSLEAVIKQYP